MAEVTGVKVNELPKKTAYAESDLIYVVSNGVDLKMEMGDLKRNVAPDVFRGATELTPGERGLVPTPTVTDSNKVLGGDGEWKELAPVATSGDFDDLNNKPEITEVEANPTDTPTTELKKLKVNATTYSILSSKVYGEATGDLITIEDAMEAPLEDCKVTLEPQQDLHGYDSPWVGGNGRNLFNMGSKVSSTHAQLTITSDDDYLIVNGTKYGSSYFTPSTLGFALPSGTYYAKAFTSGTGTSQTSVYVMNGNNPLTVDIRGGEKEFTLSEETALTIRFAFWVDNATYSDYKIGIVISKTSGIDAYSPYSNICPISGWDECKVVVSPTTDAEDGTTYTIQLGSTYYGGELDVVNGVLRVDRAMVDLGTISFRYNNANKRWYAQINDMVNYEQRSANLMFEKYQATITASVGDTGTAFTSGQTIYIYDADQTLTISGKCVYELATPQEIQLTPTEVTLLRGINNLWSDGEMYIKYRKDLDIFLNKLEARVRALEEG